MSYTLSQLIKALPAALLGSEHAKIFQKSPFITLIEKTPKQLPPEMDFIFGGELSWCEHFQFAISKTKDVDLETLDLKNHNFKLGFSAEAIDSLSITTLVNCDLIVRVMEVTDGVVTVVTLRNRYGDSLRTVHVNLN